MFLPLRTHSQRDDSLDLVFGWPVLDYPGKMPVEDVLGGKPDLSLRRVALYGTAKHGAHGWVNTLYHGDNLSLLQYLLNEKAVAGKVRLIYIDPPYSTKQDFRIGVNGRTATVSASRSDQPAYTDFLVGARFLEFLRRRLILLRELLSDDGSLYVHIDAKMGHYLKVILDEIFGTANFRNDISRIKCNPKNFERNGFGNVKDTILFYSKSEKFVWNEPRQEMSDMDVERLFPKFAADGRRYTTTPLHAPGETKNGPTGQSWKGISPPRGRHWRYPPEKLTELDKQGLIEWSSTGNPRKMIFADDVLKRGKKIQDVWDFKDAPYPQYPTEKNLRMLDTIVRASSEENDLVLDCFAGSGTTLIAAEKNGRRWVGVDQSGAAIRVAKQRLSSETPCTRFCIVEAAEGQK